MNTTIFSVAHCKSLKIRDAIDYIEEHFIPLDNGKHAFKYNGVWKIKEFYEIQSVYFNRLPAFLNDYYFKEYDRILTPVWDKTKPQFYDNYINFDFAPIKLSPHFAFIVDEYINRNLGMNIKPKDLHTQYEKYFNEKNTDKTIKLLTKNEFIDALKTVDIKSMKSGTLIYKYDFEELFEIGLNSKWYYHDLKDAEITRLKNDLWALKEMKDAEIKALKDELEELYLKCVPISELSDEENENEFVFVDGADKSTSTDDLPELEEIEVEVIEEQVNEVKDEVKDEVNEVIEEVKEVEEATHDGEDLWA